MFNKSTYILILSLVGFVLSGCTRPEGETSTVSLALPLKSKTLNQAVTAQSSNLTYIAINVTSSGMPTLFCSWDLEDKTTAGPCVFTETSVQLDIPIGSGRLFQVMMAYSDETTSAMTFKYGDSVQDINSSATTVTLTLTDVGGGAQAGGHIRARFFNNATEGPTGLLRVMMKPSSTKPAMAIQETEIYSGWFNAFSLENTPMEYLVNGQSLFGAPVNKAQLVNLMATSSGSFKVNPPGAATGDYEVWGFIGSTAGTSGKTASTTACGGSEFSSCLQSTSKFTGPFKALSAGQLLTASSDGSTHKILWNLLPGIDSTVIDGVTVMEASTDLTSDQLGLLVMSKGFNCKEYIKTSGVSNLGTVSVSASQEVTTASVHLPNTKRPLVVCPKKGQILFTSAIVSPQLENGGGCSACKYFRFELPNAVSNGDGYTVVAGSCHPVNINIFRGQGIADAASGTPNFKWNTPSWGSIHQISDCSDGPFTDPTITWASGNQNQTGSYWLKITGGTSVGNVFTVSDFNLGGEPTPISFHADHNKVDIQTPSLSLKIPAALVPNACTQLKVQTYLGSSPYQVASAISVSVHDASSSLNFYGTYADCLNNVNSTSPTYSAVNISAALTESTPFYVKRISGSSSTLTTSGGGFTSDSDTVTNGAGSGVATQFKFQISGNLNVGICSQVDVIALNASNVEVPVDMATQVEVSSSPVGAGEYYSTANCDTVLSAQRAPTVSFDPGASRVSFYFRPFKTVASFTFSALPGNGRGTVSSGAVAITVPSSGSWAAFSPPALPRTAIPSTVFPIVLPISTNITGIKCYRYNSAPNWADSGDCGSQFNPTTKVFSWSAATAAIDLSAGSIYKYYFGTQALYQSTGEGLRFFPASYYQAELKMPDNISEAATTVAICDYTIVHDGTKDFDDIQTALNNGAYNTVCLAKGVSQDFTFGTSTYFLDLPLGKSLIGSLDASYNREISLKGDDSQDVIKVTGSTMTSIIANLEIENDAGSAATAGINVSVADVSGKVRSLNNQFTVSSSTSAGSGISTMGTAVFSVDDSFQFFSLGAETPYAFKDNGYNTTSKLFYPSFSMGTVAGQFSVGVFASGDISYSSTIQILGGQFSGSGVALKSSSQTGGNATIECHSCSFSMTPSSYVGTTFGVSGDVPNFVQYGTGDITLKNSQVKNYENAPIFLYMDSTDTTTITTLENSVINQNDNAPAFSIQTDSPSISIEGNHFYSSVGNPYLVAGISASSDVSIAVPGANAPTFGRNLFCGLDASNQWVATLVQDAIQSTTTEFSPPGSILLTTTAVGGVKLCEGTH